MELASGYTLMHEHTCIDLSPGDLGTRAFDEFCADLRELKLRWGVGNIVDLTNQSMGRDVGYDQRFAEETDFSIIKVARSVGYEQAEASMDMLNERSCGLCLKMGYEDCGFLPHVEKHPGGTYRDYHRLVKMI